jgi:hypothetical protein
MAKQSAKELSRVSKVNEALWRDPATFSIDSAKEGGLGWFAITMLHNAGIPARRGTTVYEGHVGIQVPRRYEQKAERIVL